MTPRAKQVALKVAEIGVTAAAAELGISRESVRRYLRKCNSQGRPTDAEDVVEQSSVLKAIGERYTDNELRLIASGSMDHGYTHKAIHNFDGEDVTIGCMADTHIGSIYTDYSYIRAAREVFAKNGVDMVVVPGDVTEGMSNRAGHIYECSELGFNAQKEKAIELFTNFDFCPVYMIDGNHDRWYMKSNGAMIVKDICDRLPHAQFLGHDEGDIILNGSTKVKLWHGEDSSSYAISYRLQKLIESMSGGEKPDVLVPGHVHKYGKFFIRNVHCVSPGCIQKQSKWMRGKRIAAHTGFSIIKLKLNNVGVGVVTETFYPFYT